MEERSAESLWAWLEEFVEEMREKMDDGKAQYNTWARCSSATGGFLGE